MKTPHRLTKQFDLIMSDTTVGTDFGKKENNLNNNTFLDKKAKIL